MLEDPIQFALEHYELVNWRLGEAATARKSNTLEMLIIVILLGDFLLRGFEYFIHTGGAWWGQVASGIIP
jgi:hypothetical protein